VSFTPVEEKPRTFSGRGSRQKKTLGSTERFYPVKSCFRNGGLNEFDDPDLRFRVRFDVALRGPKVRVTGQHLGHPGETRQQSKSSSRYW
jgi:hypothetical protein